MLNLARTLAAAASSIVLFAAAGMSPVALSQQAGPRFGSDAPDAPPLPSVSTEAMPDAAATGDWRAGNIIGSTLTNNLGETIGDVEDVVIASDGKVVAVLVSVGGFLGLGQSEVAIGMRHIIVSNVGADHMEVQTSLTRKAVEQAASYEPEASPSGVTETTGASGR